jgi:hypothetical protein
LIEWLLVIGMDLSLRQLERTKYKEYAEICLCPGVNFIFNFPLWVLMATNIGVDDIPQMISGG